MTSLLQIFENVMSYVHDWILFSHVESQKELYFCALKGQLKPEVCIFKASSR